MKPFKRIAKLGTNVLVNTCFLLTIMSVTVSFYSFAQTQEKKATIGKLQGVVTNADGEPIVGAIVKDKTSRTNAGTGVMVK